MSPLWVFNYFEGLYSNYNINPYVQEYFHFVSTFYYPFRQADIFE